MNEDRKPWDRRPNETAKAWAAFLVYRDLPPGDRTLIAAYRKRYAKSTDIADAPPFFRRWAKENKWLDRAAAWDSHLDDVAQKVAEEERQKWEERSQELREQEWTKAQELLRRIEQMLRFPLAEVTRRVSEDGQDILQVIKPARWRESDIARFLETASKLARLATGMETERRDVTSGGEPLPAAQVTIFIPDNERGDQAPEG